MAKHLIVCGHGQGDPGAVGNGYTEAGFNRERLKPLIEKWAKQLKKNSIEFYNTSLDLYQQTAAGGGAYKLSGYSSVTELHLDASTNATATGGHVICYSGFKADSNDIAIANVVKKYVGLWGSVQASQGISYRNNLLNLNICAQRGVNYRLVELGFITNPNDVKKLVANLDAVAKGFVEAITGESLSGSATSSNTTTNTTTNKKRGNVMLLFKESGKIYWLVGNNYSYVENPNDLSQIKTMMKQAGFDTHEHTNATQIKYIKKVAKKV